jgi:hypothetical protein
MGSRQARLSGPPSLPPAGFCGRSSAGSLGHTRHQRHVPIRHQPFGMLTPVVFRDEAIPAHWREVLKSGGQIFRRKLAPLRGVLVRAKRLGCRSCKWISGKGFWQQARDWPLNQSSTMCQTMPTVRVGFNLREAFLSAILVLRPTRALIQTTVVLAERRFADGVDNIDPHDAMVCRFGAIDDVLATIAKVRAHRHGQAEGHRADTSALQSLRIRVGIFKGPGPKRENEKRDCQRLKKRRLEAVSRASQGFGQA